MRLVAGIALIINAVITILPGSPVGSAIQHVLAAAAGILLFLGLCTPIAGALVAIFEVLGALSQAVIPGCVLVATLWASLALVGHGTWSVDARLFGWRRIDLTDRQH
jgi:putative oxidoreductase